MSDHGAGAIHNWTLMLRKKLLIVNKLVKDKYRIVYTNCSYAIYTVKNYNNNW